MLAFNSYGLVKSNNNNGVSLPRLSGSGIRSPLPHENGAFSPVRPSEIRSMSKFDMMKRQEHPFYRTTTGFDYRPKLDFQDVALSVPKYARHAGFTKEYVAGPFHDTSLTSIDKSKLRAESWERKVEERTKQMKIKHEVLQQRLEVKKEQRKREREARRLELEQSTNAATLVQSIIRGFIVRSRLRREKSERYTIAATKIQSFCRSRARMVEAKRLLASKKRERLDVYAIKLQRTGRSYLLRKDAKRQLLERRLEKSRKSSPSRPHKSHQYSIDDQRHAATIIQRAMRTHVVSQRVGYQLNARLNSSLNSDGKDDNGSSNSPGSIKREIKQKSAKRMIIGSLKHRRREKSLK